MSKEKKGVRLEHISKIYKDPKTGKDFYAVKDANIEIEPGSFVTLLGPSGCGKTTTLRMIAGFESPDEGEIYLGNEPINALTPNKRDTAMVFQSYALLPHYNIFDNVAYGLKLRKMDKETIRKKVTDILGLVGLEGMENRMTNQLSGGQQQRVALARALVIEPGVLLFDEPLSNLDAKLRVSMRTEIRRIQQEAGITAIYVTHDQSEAMAISDKVIIMKGGLVEQISTPQEAYYYPNNKFVADFIGEANFLKAIVKSQDIVEINGEEVKCSTGSLGNGAECSIVLRPEGATLGDNGSIMGEVEYSCFMGAYQDYHIKIGDELVKIQEYNPKNKKIYGVGDKVYLNFEENTLYAL
ncbi:MULTISPECIES: ABC transporter ATP-binding protein [unclassified Butyrivibrio]|uniref:ABC transporter ATP-binding protein n=1 Tax=unclassified Butyrivibrio TaxID=2639466 RepID=UPI0003B66B27|nr:MULTISPECIES: ABC transporter ATP-binding protein [unclassified Butyrivibrio]SDB47488.1 iron(III) transport system ATP-binding protein [Butyrivibrio sp. INlla16]SEL81212.1 iron(III) transport system ATP-binding protein [Butyrivibrio sp. ob235]